MNCFLEAIPSYTTYFYRVLLEMGVPKERIHTLASEVSRFYKRRDEWRIRKGGFLPSPTSEHRISSVAFLLLLIQSDVKYKIEI